MAVQNIGLFIGVEPSEITLALNQLINELNFNFAQVGGGGGGGGNYVGSFTVGALPAGSNGQMAYATNGLKIGETTGNGTGVLVYYSATAWRTISLDAPVST